MVDSKNFSQQVLRKQLKGEISLLISLELCQNDDIGASVGLEDENNLYLWNVVFEGPQETLYEVWKFPFQTHSTGRLFQSCAEVPRGLPEQPT